MGKKGRVWEQWEDDYLRDNYLRLKDDKMSMELDRTVASISNRRKYLNLRFPSKKWTSSEHEYLKNAYSTGVSKSEIMKNMPNRTWMAINRYAGLNGIKRVLSNQLLEFEIKFIKDNYKNMDDEELAIRLNRKVDMIKNKRHQLKLSSRVVFMRDSNEYKFLRDNYMAMSDEDLASHFNLTEAEIKNKRSSFGFSRIKNSGRFTDEEISLLYAHFPTAPMDRLLEILPNRSEASIKTKGVLLGIKRSVYQAFWTSEKEQYIKDNFNTMTDDEIASVLKVDKSSVAHRRKFYLGLIYKNREWTIEEDSFIVDNNFKHLTFDSFLKSFIQVFGSVKKSELQTRAYRVGFKLIDAKYTDAEIRVLSDMWFNSKGIEIIKEVNKISSHPRTINSIQCQANKSGISSRDNYLQYKRKEILEECQKNKWDIIPSSLNRYMDSKTKLDYFCIDCGCVFSSIFSDYRKNTKRCSKCASVNGADAKRLSFSEVKFRMQRIHGDNIIVLSDEYERSNDKGKFKCSEDGHVWTSKWTHVLAGHGCPKCRDRKNGEMSRLTIAEVVERVKNMDLTFELISKEYISNNKPLVWKCKKCEKTFSKCWGNVISGQECPRCSDKKYKGEYRVQLELDKLGLCFEKQKTFDNCLNPETNRKLRYDFHVPEYEVLIEYDGEGHTVPIDFAGKGKEWAEQQLEDCQFRDWCKDKWAKENGYKLIRISYLNFTEIEEILRLELKDTINERRESSEK